MTNFKIRPLAETEIGVFFHLLREFADTQQSLHNVSATEEGLYECFFGKRPTGEALLAELDDEPIGYAVFFRTNSTYKATPCYFLEDLYIRPSHRGKGYGKALFVDVVRRAREEGCSKVDWVAYDWNKEAVDFYLSLGAECREDVRPYRLFQDAMDALLKRSWDCLQNYEVAPLFILSCDALLAVACPRKSFAAALYQDDWSQLRSQRTVVVDEFCRF